MRLTQDKTLKRNLRLLHACSKIEEIRLSALENERNKYLRYLKSPKGFAFKTHLINVYEKSCQMDGIAPVVIEREEELLNFLPDKRLAIPKMFERDYKRHKHVFDHLPDLQDKDQQVKEHHKLQYLATRSQDSTLELIEFMNDPSRSLNFKDFAQFTKKHSPAYVRSIYFKHAIDIATKNKFYTKKFRQDLKKTLPKPTLHLCKDFIGRTFTSAKKLIPALALSAALLIGAHHLATNELDITAGADTNFGTEQTYEDDKVIVTPGINLDDQEIFVPPISPTGTLNSYEDACDDFFKKTSEVYKYTTGEDMNLSQYGQENIGISNNAQIYVAEYNGQTYYFSSQSPYRTNSKYLREALEAAGATVTSTTSDITYIHNGDESIAIVDANGNPIKSGNIMQRANSGGGEMFNQGYVNAANAMLLKQGINTTGMSEAELVGKYILSQNYDKQNDNLSRALGLTKGLAYKIKTTFWVKDGDKEDSYAIYLYGEAAKAFAEKFNLQAKEFEDVTKGNEVPGISLLQHKGNGDDKGMDRG